MEEERKSEECLEANLSRRRPASNGCDHRLCFEVPSERRCGKVCETEQVQGTGEGDASDSIERRCVPGDLWAVDGQMRGDRPVDALLSKKLCSFRLRGRSGRSKSITSGQNCLTTNITIFAELDATMTYLLWTMRPAGATLRVGTAARCKPSWKIRWEAIALCGNTNGGVELRLSSGEW